MNRNVWYVCPEIKTIGAAIRENEIAGSTDEDSRRRMALLFKLSETCVACANGEKVSLCDKARELSQDSSIIKPGPLSSAD